MNVVYYPDTELDETFWNSDKRGCGIFFNNFLTRFFPKLVARGLYINVSEVDRKPII